MYGSETRRYNKMFNFPDNPDNKANRRFYRRWIEDNKLQMPSIMLQSYHTYFSRRVSDVWYEEVHLINPKFLMGLHQNFIQKKQVNIID